MSFVVVLIGCSSDENDTSLNIGRISFNVSINDGYLSPSDEPISLTLMSEDGEYSHTWTDINDFPEYEVFYQGKYEAIATKGNNEDEGENSPSFIARQSFMVKSGERTTVDLDLQLVQAIVNIEISQELKERFDAGATIHSSGHRYLNSGESLATSLFILPGSTSIFVKLTDEEGKEITLNPDIQLTTVAGKIYDINLGLSGDDYLVILTNDTSFTYPLSPEIFKSISPTITNHGFDTQSPIELIEGYPSADPILMTVKSVAPLQTLNLTIIGQKEIDHLHSESNLLNPDNPLYLYGLVIDKEGEYYTIDFTKLLENLVVLKSTELIFTLQAIDVNGLASDLCILQVKIIGVNLQLEQDVVSIIGKDNVNLSLDVNVEDLEIGDFKLYVLEDNTSDYHETPIESFSVIGRKVMLTFSVPTGISDIGLRVDYMGIPQIYTTIKRIVPEYKISVNAFATWCRIKILSDDEDIKKAVAKYAHLSDEGNTEIAVTDRFDEEGILVCSGFRPNRTYNISSMILPGQFKAYATFTTESAAQIPDGDFEDAVSSIDFKHLACGGIYSSSVFPIYNQQNFVDVSVSWPKKYWTSLNAKTFCPTATNHNTWYLQASSAIDYDNHASGSKSIRLTSVGWSLAGGDISPYLQEVNSYQPYSGEAPAIDNISAGYLYLGSYSFNPTSKTETYTVGIDFESRPSSLNGYYKYMPTSNYIDDRGWVKIELVHRGSDGNEEVVAKGSMEFRSSPDMKSFNVPLIYTDYENKVNKLRIIFCSSIFSESFSFVDPLVPVSPHYAEACYMGSSLWIDNLSFSY